MSKYLFQTSEFGVSENGIHLLRNGFNYQTIPFSDIHAISIRKGKQLQNWFAIFIIGAVLIAGGLIISFSILDVIISGNASSLRPQMALVFLVPFAGGYFVYNSLQTGTLLHLTYRPDKEDTLLLKDLVEKRKLGELKEYLNTRVVIKGNNHIV